MRKGTKTYLLAAELLLLSSLVLVSGCSGLDAPLQQPEVLLQPVPASGSAAMATKADPELAGTSLGTDNSYVVYLSASGTQVQDFMSGQLYSYISATSKWEASSAIGTADPVWWPLGGERLDFLALACTPAAYSALDLAWDALVPASRVTVSGWDTYENQYDLMFAATNDRTSATNSGVVDMTFRHALALVAFTAVCDDKDAVTLNKITVNGLGYSGDFVIDNTRTEVTAAWGTLTSADKVIPGTGGETSDYAFAVPEGDAAQCARHLLVPQQAARSVTLTYTMKDAVTPLDYVLTLPRTVWKAGYKYTYALHFSATEITAHSAVSAWDGSELGVDF